MPDPDYLVIVVPNWLNWLAILTALAVALAALAINLRSRRRARKVALQAAQALQRWLDARPDDATQGSAPEKPAEGDSLP